VTVTGENRRPTGPKRLFLLTGLREARAEAGVTQQELERLSGIPQVTISSLERGRRRAYPRTADALAEALGCSPIELTSAAKNRSGCGG
jgi:transcriptional regulator with XRE-family HTH domain